MHQRRLSRPMREHGPYRNQAAFVRRVGLDTALRAYSTTVKPTPVE